MNITDISMVNSIKRLYGGEILPILLLDRTTKKNIIWATDEYVTENNRLTASSQILLDDITGDYSNRIRPRVAKTIESQKDRTRNKAEVFTPSWICNVMNNYLDKEILGYSDAFNVELDKDWKRCDSKVSFSDGMSWQDYIGLLKLEITCGEAPFVTSRYYPMNGEIIKLQDRVGFLDRKLRVVSENTQFDDYGEWSLRALKSTYGYEYQGDNLLLARINVFLNWYEHWLEKLGAEPDEKSAREAAKIISWNFWQMDGLKGSVPMKPINDNRQMTIFEMLGEFTPESNEEVMCKIYDWRSSKTKTFVDIKEHKNMKKFFAIIGNPPYQEETDSDSSRMPPIYNYFMDESYKIADKVELITPARFLFDAGYTPKAWNQKMLSDKHLSVVKYEANSSVIFPNVEIKGGVAITYHDSQKEFGEIGIFTKYPELNDILKKISKCTNNYMDSIAFPPLSYGLSKKFLNENPNSLDRLRTSAFTKLAEYFHEVQPTDGDYIQIIGLINGKRTRRYVLREYIEDKNTIVDKWSYIIPEANGNGGFGETLTIGEMAEPGVAFLQTFVGMGAFDTKEEAENLSKYLKTKFARTMLGVYKITQHTSPSVWKKVPVQNFSSESDINWDKSVAEIDEQLFNKYGLSENEISFIKSNVKEMV